MLECENVSYDDKLALPMSLTSGREQLATVCWRQSQALVSIRT